MLMQQREYPSWGYEVDNGATTIWERWNSYIKGKGVHEPTMNSFSHYAFGAVCEWMMADLAGIDRAAPGFDRIRDRPPSHRHHHPCLGIHRNPPRKARLLVENRWQKLHRGHHRAT